MNTTFKYNWGQEVLVIKSAPADIHPGRKGSVCGLRELGSRNLYLIEFSDGQAVEILEDLLESIEDE